MITLNDKIVAYLTVNNISFTSEDFTTGQPVGEPDQILHWDSNILGNIPSEEQMNSAWEIYNNQQTTAANKRARSIAYQKESDPLFFKAQRGEVTMEEWLAKVEEIKARYPDNVLPQ